MNKNRFLSLSLCTMMALSSISVFVSCSGDVDDLKPRVTVIEGMISEIKQQLADSQVRCATIVSAVEDKGVWTLTLSDGKVIKITPSAGGGEAISVDANSENVIISIGDTEYVFRKGAVINSLIYVPEYTDGEVHIGNDRTVVVSFRSTPELTQEQLNDITFIVGEAHELKTRAANESSLFKVKEAKVENGFIKLTLTSYDVEAGKTYAVAINARHKNGVGSEIGSNYFNVKVSKDYSYVGEQLVEPVFADVVTDAVKNENGSYTATLPSSVDFLDTFNFKDLFKSLPEGSVTFELGNPANQNKNVQDHFSVFEQSLQKDGIWKMAGRPGTACDDETMPGLLVLVKVNDIVVHKIYWKIVDPIADVDFVGIYKNALGGHIEIAGATNDGTDMLNAGENDFDLAKLFSEAPGKGGFPVMHDGGKFINELWPNYEAHLKKKGDIIIFDGTTYVLGSEGEKYAKFSRGIYWASWQISIASSNRRNQADRPADEGKEENIAWCGGNCNGEIIGGYDGIPGEDRENMGINTYENGHLKTTANYKGWAFRADIRIFYEYAYGEKQIGGDALVWAWVNRRSCPTGVMDPVSR